MSSEIPVSIKISANPAEAVRGFAELKKRVGESTSAFQSAQQKVNEAARAWRESQKAADGLAVQVALGKKALQELGAAIGQKAPEYLALKAALKETETAFRAANTEASQSGKAFETARRGAASLKNTLDSQQVALHRARQGLGAQGVDVTRLAAEQRRLQQVFAQTRQAATQALTGGQAGLLRGIKDGTDSVSVQLATLKSQFIQLFSLQFAAGQARAVIETADAMTLLNARMKLATQGLKDFAAAKAGVIDLANRFGVSIESVGGGFARLAQAVKGMGGSTLHALQLTEAFVASARLSGATAQEAAAAMTQFGQAMGSGTLQGDELRSILEGNIRLSRALADGLGISVGELKQWGEDGKLTARAVAIALASQMQTLRDEVSTIPTTVGMAGERLKNAFALWVDGSDQVSQSQRGLISLLDALAKHMDAAIAAITVAADALIAVLAGRMAAAVAGWVVSMRTAAAGATLLSGALSFFGAPGLIVGGLTALGLAFLQLGNRAEAGAKKAATAIEQLQKQNQAARGALDAKPEKEAESRRNAVQSELDALGRQRKELHERLQPGSRFGSLLGDQKTAVEKELKAVEQKMADGLDALKQQALLFKETWGDFGVGAAKKKGLEAWNEAGQAFRDKAAELRDAVAETLRLAKEAGLAESAPEVQQRLAAVRAKFAEKPHKTKHTPADNDARQILEAELSQQREFLQLEEEALKSSFDRKAIDAESYYQRLAALRDADFAAQIEAKRQELSLATDRGDQAKILSELAVLEAQRAQAAQSATQDLISAREQEKEQVQTLLDAYDQQGAALRKLKEDAERFQQFLKTGLISPEQAAAFSEGFSKQWQDAVKGTKDATDEMSQYADQAARNMQDAFADFLFDPFQDGLDGMLKGFVDTIRRMAAEALSTSILESLNILKPSKNGGTEAGGLLTALFGGTGGGESPKAPTAAPATASLVPDSFFDGLQADFTTGLDGVRAGLAESGGGLSEFFSGFGALLSDGLKSLVDGLGGLFSGIGKMGSGLWDGLGSLFSGLGGLFGFASGGYVSGPGSATSDSIPARLSNGEYVLNARSVSRLGVGLLDWMNGGAVRPAYPAMAFAAGGLVQGGAPAAQPPINLRVVNAFDHRIVGDYLATPPGEKALLNVVRRNSDAIKSLLA